MQYYKWSETARCCVSMVTVLVGVIGSVSDLGAGLSESSVICYSLTINASDDCGLEADHSSQVMIRVDSTTSGPRFTASLYSFTVSRQAIPGHVIGYLHLITGNSTSTESPLQGIVHSIPTQ